MIAGNPLQNAFYLADEVAMSKTSQRVLGNNTNADLRSMGIDKIMIEVVRGERDTLPEEIADLVHR